jgi:hypothetical protein
MSIRVREERYISSLLLEVTAWTVRALGGWITVAIDNIDKLGGEARSARHGTLAVSVAYVSRERYVCLTGENLAGLIIAPQNFAFFPRPPIIAPQNFAFFPRPPNIANPTHTGARKKRTQMSQRSTQDHQTRWLT